MALGRGQRGSALIAVLWVGLFLGLLSVGLVAMGRIAVLQGRNAAEALRLEMLADAGIETVVAQLLGGPVVAPINGNTSLRLSGLAVELRVQDALGLVDINQAPVEVLGRLFVALGLSDMEAQTLADAIADWRDSDDLRRLHGAEQDSYIETGRRHLPRNRGFERVDELRHVFGMTSTLLAHSMPYLTVHGGPIIDLDAAPLLVAQVADGLNSAALTKRREGQMPMPSILAPGRAYRIEARSVGARMVISKTVWVRLTGHTDRPIWFLDVISSGG